MIAVSKTWPVETIKPLLELNEKVCFLVMDAMRLDHFMELYPIMSENFSIQIDPSISILPSATPFARNSIFSGLFPDEFCKQPMSVSNCE